MREGNTAQFDPNVVKDEEGMAIRDDAILRSIVIKVDMQLSIINFHE